VCELLVVYPVGYEGWGLGGGDAKLGHDACPLKHSQSLSFWPLQRKPVKAFRRKGDANI